MIRKELSILFLILGMMLFAPEETFACEFYFQVDNAKESYAVGDEIIVTVTLELTHRNCPVKPEETIFKGEGMEILGATQWVKISSMLYARKFKIKITEATSRSELIALRECEKDGGKGSITFEKS